MTKTKAKTETKTKTKTKTTVTNYITRPNKKVYRNEPTSFLKAKRVGVDDPYESQDIMVFGGKDYTKEWQENPLVTAHGIDEDGFVHVVLGDQELTFSCCSLNPLYVALGEVIKGQLTNIPVPFTPKTTKAKKTTKKRR